MGTPVENRQDSCRRIKRQNVFRTVLIAMALLVATALFVSSPAFAATQIAVNSGISSSSVGGTAAAGRGVGAHLSAEALAAGHSSSCSTSHFRPLGTLRVIPTQAEIDVSIRLLAASLGGAAVGLERSSSDRPAGVRTMSLVSLGAAAFTICSMYGFLSVASSVSGAKFDPSRMASNVASGVGFIGAGVITNNRKAAGVYDRQSSVNGLTTAAAIWVSAAVGVACGVGLFVVGAAAALSTIAILRFGRVKNTGLGQRVMSIGTKRTTKKSTSASASASAAAAAAAPTLMSTQGPSISNTTASLLNSTSTFISLSGKTDVDAKAVDARNRSATKIAGDGLAGTSKLKRDLITSGAGNRSFPENTAEELVQKSMKVRMAYSLEDADIDLAEKRPKLSSPVKLDREQHVTQKKSQQLIDPLLEKYLWGDVGEESRKPTTTFDGLPIPPTSFPSGGPSAAGHDVVNTGSRSVSKGEGRSTGNNEKLTGTS